MFIYVNFEFVICVLFNAAEESLQLYMETKKSLAMSPFIYLHRIPGCSVRYSWMVKFRIALSKTIDSFWCVIAFNGWDLNTFAIKEKMNGGQWNSISWMENMLSCLNKNSFAIWLRNQPQCTLQHLYNSSTQILTREFVYTHLYSIIKKKLYYIAAIANESPPYPLSISLFLYIFSSTL